MKQLLLMISALISVNLCAQSTLNFTTATGSGYANLRGTWKDGNTVNVFASNCYSCIASVISSTNNGVTFTSNPSYSTIVNSSGTKLESAVVLNNTVTTACYRFDSWFQTWNAYTMCYQNPNPPGTSDSYFDGVKRIVKVNSSTAYMFCANQNNPTTYKSIDAGATWSVYPASTHSISMKSGTVSVPRNTTRALDDAVLLGDGTLIGIISQSFYRYDSTIILSSPNMGFNWTILKTLKGNISGLWGDNINDMYYFNTQTVSSFTNSAGTRTNTQSCALYHTTDQFGSSQMIPLYIDGQPYNNQQITYFEDFNKQQQYGYSNYGWFKNPVVINNNLVVTCNVMPVGPSIGSTRILVADLSTFVNIKENELEKKIQLYPNPSSSLINFDYETPVNYAIKNITGQLLLSGTGNQADVSGMAPGIYFITLSAGKQSVTKKFVKD